MQLKRKAKLPGLSNSGLSVHRDSLTWGKIPLLHKHIICVSYQCYLIVRFILVRIRSMEGTRIHCFSNNMLFAFSISILYQGGSGPMSKDNRVFLKK